MASRSHNRHEVFNSDRAFNIILTSLGQLLDSGAFASHTPDWIKLHFARFKMVITCSKGGNNRAVNDENLGATYYKWSVGPFELDPIVDLDADYIEHLSEIIYDKLTERLEDLDIGASEGADNSDLIRDVKNFPPKSPESLAYRREVFLRRMDEATFKFLPRYYRESVPHATRPINYRQAMLSKDDVLGNVRLFPMGRTNIPILSNDYNAHHPVTGQFRNLNATTTQLQYDMKGIIIPKMSVEQLDDIERDQNAIRLLSGTEARLYNDDLNNNPFVTHATEPIALPDAIMVEKPLSAYAHDAFFQRETDAPYPAPYEESEESSVGCLVAVKDRLEAYFLRLSNIYAAPFDKHDNDCFLRCYFTALKLEENAVSFAKLREALEMGPNDHFKVPHLQKLSNNTNEVFHVWQIVEADYAPVEEYPEIAECKISKMFSKLVAVTPEVGDQDSKKERTHIHFLWYKGHCYLIHDPKFVVDKVKCVKCTQWVKMGSFKNHYIKCFYCTVCRKGIFLHFFILLILLFSLQY